MNKHFTLQRWRTVLFALACIIFSSPLLTAQSVLATRNVSNTELCSDGTTYGIYILLQGEDNYHTLQWASFSEYSDGTAKLIGTAVNNSNPDIKFNIDLIFTGRTFSTPEGSPKDHNCFNPNTDDWYYYTAFSGTYTGVGSCWGTNIDVESYGPAFQVGNGANATNNGTAFGASGWAKLTIASQASWGPQLQLEPERTGDINIDLSGAPLTPPAACNNVTNGGTIGTNQTVCAGDAAATLTNVAAPSGGSGAIEYLWLSSTNGCPTSINQAIAGATGATYNPGVLSQTTYFVRCSRRAGCDSWTQGESNCVTVTVDTDPACGNTCDNVTSGGTIGTNQTVCAGDAAATLTSVAAPSGGSGAIEYLWLSSTNGCPTSVNQAIAGATGATYNPGVLSQTTYFVRCSRRAGCDSWTQGESNCVTVTVDTDPACGGGGGNCSDISITTGNGTIVVSGLDATPVASVQVFNSSWSGEFSCFANCDVPVQTINVSAGTYYVYVKLYSASYSQICEINETITVTNGGGCTDNDGDGVCADEDCDDNNSNIPTTPGSICNDGNASTINDVIQADGCTCAGTVVTTTCNKYQILDSTPECGAPSNTNQSGVFYQSDCGQGYTVWQAGPDLMLTENGDGTASIEGTITSNGNTATVSINLSGYSTNGNNWGNNCYNNNLTPQYFYTDFSGTITEGGVSYTFIPKNTDFVFGPGANNQSDGSLGLGAWAKGSWGTCVEMFATLNALNPGDSCDDGNASTINDVVSADGCTCAGTPAPPTCTADAGSLVADNSSVQLNNGSAVISASAGGGLLMPAGYEKVFVLTQGTGLVIREVSNDPSFTVNAAGSYTIHTLVYDPNTLDLSTIQIGTTTGFDVNALLIQGGGSICASLDVTGAPITVTPGSGGGNNVDLALAVEGDGSDVAPYTNFTVTVTVTNEGNATSNNVVVNVPQPANVVFQGSNPSTATQGSYNSYSTFNWTVGTLTPGQSETLTLNYFSLAGGSYTVYGQVQSASGNDVDSTPGNGTPTTPNEDDEDVYTTGDGGNPSCPLNLVANVSNVVCNDNGTPDNPNDDTFTFSVNVTGGGPWGWTGGGQSGNYGQAVTFGPYPISGGNISFTVRDNDNQTCTANVNATAPATCSNGGGGGGGGTDCSDISIVAGNGTITVSGLDNAPLTSLWIFDAGWSTVFNCSYGCDATEVVTVAPGTYNIIVKKLNPDWSVICEVSEQVTVTGGGPTGDLTLTGPSNITVTAAPGATGAPVTYPEPVANTTCTAGGLNLQRIAGPASGSVFPIGTTTITYQATDACNNSETVSFTITVNQGTPSGELTLSQPNNITVNAEPGANTAVVTYPEPIANTTCTAGGLNLQRIAGPASGSAFPVGTTTITYQATDACNNSKTVSFTITVNPTSSHITISCPANITVDAAPGANGATVTYGNANANTNCAQGGLNVSVTQGPNSGSYFPVGTTTVKYTATDACNSMEMCTFTVTVNATALVPCEVRTVSEADNNCNTNTSTRAFYAANLISGINGVNAPYYVQNGVFEEFPDGTARFTGRFVNNGNSNVRWNAEVLFSGRTFGTPTGSPKASNCYSINDNDFYYYTNMDGTLTGTNHIAGAVIDIALLGEAMQVGTGASLFDHDAFGASTWLSYTIVSQPNNGNVHLNTGGTLDFNWELTGGPLDCPDAPQPGDCDLDVLFVVGNTNLNSGDDAVRDRLVAQGYNVMLINEHNAQTSSANGKDLVIISSTVLSSNINVKFRNVAIPVMTWESYLFDDMRLTGTAANTSYGSQWGVRKYTVASNHPINSGLSGTFNVFNSDQDVRWGLPYSAANDVGFIPGHPNRCMIIAYDQGQQMFGSFVAPARRVGFFLDNTSATHLNSKGWRLFDQTIYWLTQCTPANFDGDAVEQFTQDNTQRENDNAEFRTETATTLDFGVFPNPATSFVNVSLTDMNGAAVTINVIDQLGRIVEHTEADSALNSVYRINTANYKAGMYIISVQAADAPVITKPLVILPH